MKYVLGRFQHIVAKNKKSECVLTNTLNMPATEGQPAAYTHMPRRVQESRCGRKGGRPLSKGNPPPRLSWETNPSSQGRATVRFRALQQCDPRTSREPRGRGDGTRVVRLWRRVAESHCVSHLVSALSHILPSSISLKTDCRLTFHPMFLQSSCCL